MEAVARGDWNTGCAYLGDVAASPVAALPDPGLRRFIHAVFIQLLRIRELALEPGSTLSRDTLSDAYKVWRAARAGNDQTLAADAQALLARWRHPRDNGKPVIALDALSPLIMQVEPTNHCNLRCTMCPRQSMGRDRGHLDPGLLARALETWENRTRTISLEHLVTGRTITLRRKGGLRLFFMGEPLLHPDIDSLVRLGREAGCTVGVQTNGVLLRDPAMAERLLAARPATIGVSLDGISSGSHAAVRKGSAFSEVCEALRGLSQARTSMGLDREVAITICSILPTLDARHSARAMEFLAPVRDCVDHIGFIPLSRERDPVFFDEHGCVTQFADAGGRSIGKGEALCAEALFKMNMLWDGTLTPCCYDIDGEMPLGGVEQGVDQVWNGDKAVELRRSLLSGRLGEFPMCRRCLGLDKNKAASARKSGPGKTQRKRGRPRSTRQV